MTHKLELRNATHEREKLNSKGRQVKVGIKQLILALKSIVYPNEEEKRKMSKKEKEKFKYFEPMHLNSLQWGEITVSNPNRELDCNAESQISIVCLCVW